MKYKVYRNKIFYGETTAVSEKQAINNVRYNNMELYEIADDDVSNWTAVSMSSSNTQIPDMKDSFNKMHDLWKRHGLSNERR